MKVSKSIEKRGILLQGTARKTTSQERKISQFSWVINDSGFTINEKCIYTSS